MLLFFSFADELEKIAAVGNLLGAVGSGLRQGAVEAWRESPHAVLGTIGGAALGGGAGLAHGLQKDEQGQRHVARGLVEGGLGAAVGGFAGKHVGRALGATPIGVAPSPVPVLPGPLSVQPDPFPPDSIDQFFNRGRGMRDAAMARAKGTTA